MSVFRVPINTYSVWPLSFGINFYTSKYVRAYVFLTWKMDGVRLCFRTSGGHLHRNTDDYRNKISVSLYYVRIGVYLLHNTIDTLIITIVKYLLHCFHTYWRRKVTFPVLSSSTDEWFTFLSFVSFSRSKLWFVPTPSLVRFIGTHWYRISNSSKPVTH